ncbi:MAG TPA: hypothetical protein ENJ50_04445 [Planctomycetaceae bacterium]|nr:hypothetical protein [Planctomycetaceae bacterium]
MADLLETGSNWLQDQRTQHMSRTVTYERGIDTVSLSATVGRTVFEIDDGRGVIQRHEARDFLVLADDLVLAGSKTLPQAGDRVRETQGTTVFVYEVMAPGNEPVWRYSDPYRKTLRIHTKHIRTE